MVAHLLLSDVNLEWSTPQPRSESSSPRRLSSYCSSERNNADTFSESNGQHSVAVLQTGNGSGTPTSTFSSVRSLHSPLSTTSNEERGNIEVDPYNILGLNNRDATLEEVKKAYKRIALLCHPRRSASHFGVRSNCSSVCQNDTFNSCNSSNPESVLGKEDDRVKKLHYNEEHIREWHFIVVAASYETLCDEEYRKQYDSIWKQSQLPFINRKRKHQKKKGFWRSFRKDLDSRLDIIDSFDQSDYRQEGVTDCGCGNDGNTSSLFNVCGRVEQSMIHTKNNKAENNDNQEILSVIQYTSGGKKPMLDCKPLLLSNHEFDPRQTSVGTEASAFTEEDGNGDFIRNETNYLFGGPLALMFKARQYQPFSDAFELFRVEFGSDIFRTKSCFDDDDEEDDDDNPNDFAKKWISGGNGGLFNESRTMTSSSNLTVSSSCAGSKPALVYPVLPNIPLEVLDQYGVLDGRDRYCKSQGKTAMVSNDSNNLSTEIKFEKKNGVSTEITVTTKINGKMRVVRTKTTTISENGKKKTVTSVKRQNIPLEELIMKQEEERINKQEGFIDLVPCCSFSTRKEINIHSNRPILDEDSAISSTSSNSKLLPMGNFQDKTALKQRIGQIFLTQQKVESRRK